MAQKNRTMAFIWFEVAAFRLSVSPEDHNENPAPFFSPPLKKTVFIWARLYRVGPRLFRYFVMAV